MERSYAAQHAMACILGTLVQPGDVILCEELTFPGMKDLADFYRVRLRPLPIDRHGIVPEGFDRACRDGEARLLYTIPTIHNPTASVMPRERRENIASIAREHGLHIIEDGVYNFLLEDGPPPIATMASSANCPSMPASRPAPRFPTRSASIDVL